jgi:hypothetical protein
LDAPVSKSTKRVRSKLRQTWLTAAEDASAKSTAKAAGVTFSELIRVALFRYRLPPLKIDREIANQLLTEMQAARGAWNKIGNNINQIVKEVNMARTPRLASFESEWLELKDRVDRDFSEFRSLLMQAMGEERKRKKPHQPRS